MLSGITQAKLNAVARELNGRARETLGLKHRPKNFNELLRCPVEAAVRSGH